MSNNTMLDAIDPEILDTLVSRRDAIARGVKVSTFTTAALALGSVPVALGALATTAGAQGTANVVVDVLQYALLLENFEAEFYKAVLGTSTVAAFNAAFAPVRATVPAAAIPTLTLIRDHEIKHVDFLRTVLQRLGATPVTYAPAATFDFTGGRGTGTPGPFAPATTDLAFLLAVTQAVEDTGVRAYKGQAGKLLRNGAVLTPALQIHAVEARHAAKIRRLRRAAAAAASANNFARYSGTIRGGGAPAAGFAGTPPAAVAAAFAAIYGGEENTTHTVNNGTADVPIDAATLPGLSPGADVTLAFDDALPATTVRNIVQPFVIPDIVLPASLAQG